MNDLKHLSDENLLDLLKAEQVCAFEELYERYWSKLYSNAYNRIRIAEVAEEIVQDFFTSLWVTRKSLVVRSSFNNYTHTAIRNLVFKYYQKEYKLKEYQESRKINMVEGDFSTEQEIEFKDLKRVLDLEVESLSPKCRGVFNLSRNEYKSNKEIAALMEISENTVENHMSKALRVLRLSIKNLNL